MDIIELVGPNRAVSVFGIKLVGFTAENGMKLILMLVFFLLLWCVARILKKIFHLFIKGRKDAGTMFWSNQAINIFVSLMFVVGFLSVWFDDPVRLTTAFGLISAGLAFALQRVITAVAGYVIILRGKLFNVGDRISMGGVRGDVIQLRFTSTSVMEMGQPPAVQMADPAMWIKARQFTGRIVTITNDKVFDTPVYNYTRDFPYLWEEMAVMIKYTANRLLAEQILIEVANRHTLPIRQLSESDLVELERRYMLKLAGSPPTVYHRITDNWLELSVRFITKDHEIREVKDRMSRDILDEFDKAGLEIASATLEIFGLPCNGRKQNGSTVERNSSS